MAVVKAGLAAAALLLIAARPVPAPVPAAAPAAVAPSVRAGVEKWKAGDYPAAVAMWQGFAAAGDPDAMFNMGQAYKLGRGVAPDAAIARDYYRKAATKGHLPAQANLGIALFQVGEKPEAIKWLKTAADRGEARAQYVLGIAAYNGDGLPRSQAVGYGYLLRAQASGLPQATTALGSIAPALSPTDRTAGEAVAASIASGNGVPAALAAAIAPKLIAPSAGDVLKPLPGTTPKPVATASAVLPKPTVVPVTSTAAPLPTAIAQTRPASPAPAFASITPAPKPAASTLAPPAASGPTRAVPVSNPQAVASAPSSSPAKATDKPGRGPVLGGAPAANAPPVAVATTDIAASRPAPTPAASPAPPAVRPAEAPIPAPVAVAKAEAMAPKPAVATPAAKPSPVATAALKPFETVIPAKPVVRKPGWRVQLGAFSARKQADLAWAAVKADAGTSKPIFDADGPVVKLQIGPFATRDAAKAACARLSDAGRSCFVTEG